VRYRSKDIPPSLKKPAGVVVFNKWKKMLLRRRIHTIDNSAVKRKIK
jgi:hypothetical protein